MENQITLPQELVEEINILRKKLIDNQSNLAQHSILIEKMNREMDITKKEYSKLMDSCISLEEDLKNLADGIVEKYGEGDLDIENGNYYIKS
jgi:hypothetical protein